MNCDFLYQGIAEICPLHWTFSEFIQYILVYNYVEDVYILCVMIHCSQLQWLVQT